MVANRGVINIRQTTIVCKLLIQWKDGTKTWMTLNILKMDFTRKSRQFKDGHHTPYPKTSSYAGFVSRNSIRISFTTGALQGFASDTINSYL